MTACICSHTLAHQPWRGISGQAEGLLDLSVWQGDTITGFLSIPRCSRNS